MMVPATIDLNCDLGEQHEGVDEAALMAFTSSCNVACGGHAGDQHSMRQTVSAAIEHRVAVGAHPSYPDRVHFGRLSVDIDRDRLRRCLVDQCRALMDIAVGEGAEVRHVKAHGALYNDIAAGGDLAAVFLDAVQEVGCQYVYGLAGSALAGLTEERELRFVHEAFADRRYRSAFSLLPRSRTGAVLTKTEEVRDQVAGLTARGEVATEADGVVSLSVDTICVHSDTPSSVGLLRAVRETLQEHDLDIRPPS